MVDDVVVEVVPPSRCTVGVGVLLEPPVPARLVWTTGSLVMDRCGKVTVVPGALQSGVAPGADGELAGAAGTASGMRVAGALVRGDRWTAGVAHCVPADVLRSPVAAAVAAWELDAGAANAERWMAGPPSKLAADARDGTPAGCSVGGAHHGLGRPPSPSSSSPPDSSSASRWSTTAGRMGLCAAMGRITGTAGDRWIGTDPAPALGAPGVPEEAAGADGDDAPALAAWLAPAASRADLEMAITGRDGREGIRATSGAETDRWTGASPALWSSSPASSSPLPTRWIVVRRLEVASGIGPAIVERLTTGAGSEPTGLAAAGSEVGSPTPRRTGP